MAAFLAGCLVDASYNYCAVKSRTPGHGTPPSGARFRGRTPGLQRFACAEHGLQGVVAAYGEFAPNLRGALRGNSAASQRPRRQDRRVDGHDCAYHGDVFREAVYVHAALREIVNDAAAFVAVLTLYQAGNRTVAG